MIQTVSAQMLNRKEKLKGGISRRSYEIEGDVQGGLVEFQWQTLTDDHDRAVPLASPNLAKIVCETNCILLPAPPRLCFQEAGHRRVWRRLPTLRHTSM